MTCGCRGGRTDSFADAPPSSSTCEVIFEANGMVMKLLKHFIHEEVQNSDDPATLFRGNCIASKIMKAYSKVEGSGEKRSGRRQGGETEGLVVWKEG